MRGVISNSDFIGYRHQFDRLTRLHARIFAIPENEQQFQDNVFSFFMHCFHLTDWVAHDPVAPKESKRKVRQALAKSGLFPIYRDIACGVKHLKLDNPKSGVGARYLFTQRTMYPGEEQWAYDIVFDDGKGQQLSALTLAGYCMREWRTILEDAGLTTQPLGWEVRGQIEQSRRPRKRSERRHH